MELAYATMRMCLTVLDRALQVTNEKDDDDLLDRNNNHSNINIGMILSRSGDVEVEYRIAALSFICCSSSSTATSSDSSAALLPTNYNGPSNPAKQKRQDQIAKLFKRHIPEIPLKRLSSLLQQSVKWQCHTRIFCTVQWLFQSIEEEEDHNKNLVVGEESTRIAQ